MNTWRRVRGPIDVVVTWRVEAERQRRRAGAGALTDPEARDYVERFLPAYRGWATRLREHAPCADAICVQLGEDRAPRGCSLTAEAT